MEFLIALIITISGAFSNDPLNPEPSDRNSQSREIQLIENPVPVMEGGMLENEVWG